MNLELHFVRHAESTANVGGRTDDAATIPLTPEGDRQAVALGERLWDTRWDKIVCSSFLRAQETARPYLEATKQRAETWPIHEWTYLDSNTYRGTNKDERAHAVRAYLDRMDPMLQDGDAESWHGFILRVHFTFELARVWGGRILAFSHGRFMQAAQFWVDHCQDLDLTYLYDPEMMRRFVELEGNPVPQNVELRSYRYDLEVKRWVRF